jgi:hypothetical protein
LDRSTLLPSAGLDTGSIINSHHCSNADLGLRLNSAAALSDKLLRLAEAETRTLPNWLRREIGVERSPKHFVRHAASVIGDHDFYHPSRRSCTRRTVLRQDYDLATVLQRCVRIATPIEESEVNILWIGHKIGEILGSLGVK